MTGLTLGGGCAPLIGRSWIGARQRARHADRTGRWTIEFASAGRDEELFRALRGGGGNFGVVAGMCSRSLHELPGARIRRCLVFPFSEAKSVLDNCAAIAAAATRRIFRAGRHRGLPWWLLRRGGSCRRGAARRSKATAGSRQCCTLGLAERHDRAEILRRAASYLRFRRHPAIAGVPRLLLAADPRRRQHRHVSAPGDEERRFLLDAPSLPTTSRGRPRACPRMGPRSACGATPCPGRSILRCFPREEIRVTNSSIHTGCTVPAKPFTGAASRRLSEPASAGTTGDHTALLLRPERSAIDPAPLRARTNVFSSAIPLPDHGC